MTLGVVGVFSRVLRRRRALLAGLLAALIVSCKPPAAPSPPPPPAEPPPPPPKCEAIEEGCLVKEGERAVIEQSTWTVALPIGWTYAHAATGTGR